MINTPTVTILMAVHNDEKFIKQAIDSILNQDFTDFEFIIINDASNDLTKQIILSFNDPRINLIENKTRIGLTKSLNKGIHLAKGIYVARMDSDDLSLPDRIKKQVDFLNKSC